MSMPTNPTEIKDAVSCMILAINPTAAEHFALVINNSTLCLSPADKVKKKSSIIFKISRQQMTYGLTTSQWNDLIIAVQKKTKTSIEPVQKKLPF